MAKSTKTVTPLPHPTAYRP